MANKNISPEKRLLEIIEGKRRNAPAASPLETGKKYFSLASLRARLEFLREKAGQLPGKRKLAFPDTRTVNMLLQAAIALLLVVLGIGMKFERDSINKGKIFTEPQATAEAQAQSAELVSLLKPPEFYLEKTQARDLFKLGERKQSQPVDFREGEKKASSKLQDMTVNLRLVGISWSEDPDAIIEDTKLEKTYFVKKNYMIEAIVVKEISKDKVVLRYQGEEVELR